MIGIYSKGEAPDSGKYELWVDGAGFSEFQVAEACGISKGAHIKISGLRSRSACSLPTNGGD